jgi:hypothetical protein
VEALGLSQDTAEALGIGYAPKGMTKDYVAIPIRLPTGELTGYIGITEAKLPKEFHLSNVVTFPRRVRKKSPARMRGFLFYLLRPEPEPLGASVDPLGEALGPRVFPDGLWVLFGEVTEAPAVPVVLPFEDEPVVLPVAAEPAEVPPAVPLDEAPPACASAKALESAKAVANAIVLSFMVVSWVNDQG